MHHPRRARTISAAAIVGVLAAVATVNLGASPAFAGACPIGGSFTPPSQSVEYGQYWSFTAAGTGYFDVAHTYNELKVVSTGTPSAYAPELYNSTGSAGARSTISAPYDVAPLAAGSYSFALTAVLTSPNDECDSYSGQTDSAQLTIAPAKVGVELRVIPDPTNVEAAILTARFTGRFVDEYQSSFFPGAAVSPAGMWRITVTDSDGEVATERSVERAAGDDVLATSFYWSDGEPGEMYTASAEFTPDGTSATNFTITQAGDFDFTAAEPQRPVPTSTAAAEPDTSLPAATGFSLPLWLIVIVGALIVGLGVLVTILGVRLSRRSSATTKEAAV